MIRIQKGNHETIVTKGVFESQFKPLGYTIVSEKKVENVAKTTDKESKNDDKDVKVKDNEIRK